MTLEQFAEQVIAQCADKAAAAGCPVPRVRVTVPLRGRSVAGQAARGVFFHTVRLNRGYWEAQGADYAATIAHEYAHCMVFDLPDYSARRRAGKLKPHGAEWAHFMRVLGYPPHRCVQAHEAAPPKARRTRRFEYRCPACGYLSMFTSGQHRTQDAATQHCSSAGYYHQARNCSGTGSRRYAFTGKMVLE